MKIRSKKLLVLLLRSFPQRAPKTTKVFWFFFSKKNRLPCVAACALAACTTTSVIDSENPSKNRPPQWTDYWSLPVDVHGAVPHLPQPALAALFPTASPAPQAARRVELFLNPASMPPNDALCSRTDLFVPGMQSGAYAFLAGALCNGTAVVTYATAHVLTAGITPDQVRGHLEMMHLQLWQALTYGNNHPEQVHPSWMYGP